MVKQLDEKPEGEPIDHVGWDLWRASQAWKARFVAGMTAAGHGWFGEARANLLGHLDRAGTPQSELVRRMGTTKQAVQQLVDELAAEGIVTRAADPGDRRAKIVRLTAAGLEVIRDADRVKRRIDGEYRALLGARRFADLQRALRILSGA